MRLKEERASLEEKRQLLYAEEKAPMAKQAQVKQLVERFFLTQENNKRLLASLIEKVELTEDKETHIHFRFHQLEPQNHLQ
jgi:uncharacterized protein YfcZ (UPF0381/DUF406 family)